MSESETQKNAMQDLTKAVLTVLDSWELSPQEMHLVLGLPESIKSRHFQRYRQGADALPADEAILKHIQIIIKMGDALHTSYPCNPKMASRWLRTVHRRFKPYSPLKMMIEEGENGLISALAELDCTYSWDCSGSNTTP